MAFLVGGETPRAAEAATLNKGGGEGMPPGFDSSEDYSSLHLSPKSSNLLV